MIKFCNHCGMQHDCVASTDFNDYDISHMKANKEITKLRAENERLRDALEQERAEVARLTKAITFEQHWLERIGTHGPGCYQWGPSHWLCAVNEIKRLAALRGEGE